VIRRGKRPTSDVAAVPVGRLGGVGKEAIQQAKDKLEGKGGVLIPLEGSEDTFHVMTDPTHQNEIELLEEVEEANEREKEMSDEEMERVLRKEAYGWPRLVYPPIKRSGHVVMDTCHSSGESTKFRSYPFPKNVCLIPVLMKLQDLSSDSLFPALRQNKHTTMRVKCHGVICSHTKRKELKSCGLEVSRS
jgi:hypothetical protein